MKAKYTYSPTSSPFKIPEGLSFKDACDVVSYLFICCESNDMVDGFGSSMPEVSRILEDWGFEKIENAENYKFYTHVRLKRHPIFVGKDLPNNYVNYANEGIVDLITFDCGDILYNHSALRDYEFDWFNPNVTSEQIDEIYKNAGYEMIGQGTIFELPTTK